MDNEIKLRWYQNEAVEKLMSYFDTDDGHPIVVVPTGAGKTIILCEFVNEYLSNYPGSKILVLSHVKEIIEQDYNALISYFDGYDVGLYSSGLGSRTIKHVTVAGIQSVYTKSELFEDVNLVVIDECHLINHNDTGMYRNFLSKLTIANYVGLTATHFRTGHGYIHEGEDALFTDIVYDLSSMDNFNRLVSEGYLTKLISKATENEMDVSGLSIIAGDYKTNELSSRFDRESITEKIIDEVIKYGKKYKSWLIFAIDIEHAEHISAILNNKGINTACVHSKMVNRDEEIEKFKSGYYRAMVNVDILTTGFDYPNIDLIAMLRPTQSPILHVQTAGRGLRVAEDKTHCLVLDFAGNTERLGPINNVKIKTKYDKKNGTENPITKRCPSCQVIHHPSVKICDVCGHEFEFKEKLKTQASSKEIVQTDKQKIEATWLDVTKVYYSIHQKKGSPSSLRVHYVCGLNDFSEWICYDHPPGFAKHKANSWVKYRIPAGYPMPLNVIDLFRQKDKLKTPSKILVDTSDRFPRIKNSIFADEIA